MFKFSRKLILPLFLERRISLYQFAKKAGVSAQTLWKALNGYPVSSKVIDKIARALNIDAINFLENAQDTQDATSIFVSKEPPTPAKISLAI